MPSSDTVAHDHVMLQYLLTYPMFSNSIIYMPCDSVMKSGYMYIRDNLYKYFNNYSAKHIISTASISPILLCPTRYEGLAIPRLIGFWLLPGCTLVWYIDVPWLVGCHFKGRRERESCIEWLIAYHYCCTSRTIPFQPINRSILSWTLQWNCSPFDVSGSICAAATLRIAIVDVGELYAHVVEPSEGVTILRTSRPQSYR